MVIAALGFSSCKKEEMATPSAKPSAQKVADRSTPAGWD